MFIPFSNFDHTEYGNIQKYGLDLAINIFAKETKETKELNAKLHERKFHRDNGREKQGALPEQRKLVKQIRSVSSFLSI